MTKTRDPGTPTLRYVSERTFKALISKKPLMKRKVPDGLGGETIQYGDPKRMITVASESPALDEHRYALWKYPEAA